MKAVGVRELKDKLSRYLDEVKRGEVVLVTDRGVVVAELRQPSRREASTEDPLEARLRPYVEAGLVSEARPKPADAYPRLPGVATAAEIDQWLDESRGDR